MGYGELCATYEISSLSLERGGRMVQHVSAKGLKPFDGVGKPDLFVAQQQFCVIFDNGFCALDGNGEILKRKQKEISEVGRCNGISVRHHFNYSLVGGVADPGNNRKG